MKPEGRKRLVPRRRLEPRKYGMVGADDGGMEWDDEDHKTRAGDDGGGGPYEGGNEVGAKNDDVMDYDDGKEVGGGGSTDLGTNKVFKSKDIHKGMEGVGANKMIDGAERQLVGGLRTRNAMEWMMSRKIPEREISRPIKKRGKGAKSKFGKGKIKGKTVSSQLGVARLPSIRKWLIDANGLDIGIGMKNSPGSSARLYNSKLL